MTLLNGFTLPPGFEIETPLIQACEEDPNLILEQLIFSSTLDFDGCLQRLVSALALRHGEPGTPLVHRQGDVAVANYTFDSGATRITAQLSCEGDDQCCQGFIHATTRWQADTREVSA